MGFYKKFFFWLVVFARIIILPLFFFYPFSTMLVSMLFDWLDSFVWVHKLGLNKDQYYKVDKIVDFTMYFVALTSSLHEEFFMFLLLLFVYRQIGYLIQLFKKRNVVYLLFPNFFEFAFLWCFAAKILNISFMGKEFIVILTFLFILKIAQEYWLYVFWPKHTKENGYPEVFLRLGFCRKDGYL